MERPRFQSIAARVAVASALAVGGAKVAQEVTNHQDDNFTSTAHALELDANELSEIRKADHSLLTFREVCVDPAGDKHPRTVDILRVEQAEVDGRTYFRFTLGGDPAMPNGRSPLKPDIGLLGGFTNKSGQVEVIFHAMGAPRAEDTLVAFERLENPVTIDDQGANQLRVAERLYEETGVGNITNNDGKVTFSSPTEVVDRYGVPTIFMTTTGEGHGNPNSNPQVQNKDECEVPQQPPAVEPPVFEGTPTPQKPGQPGQPGQLTPEVPVSLPTTGGGQVEEVSLDIGQKVNKGIAVGILTGLGSFGLLGIYKSLRRNRK